MKKLLLFTVVLVVGILAVAAIRLAGDRQPADWPDAGDRATTREDLPPPRDAFEEGERQLDDREEAIEQARERIRLITGSPNRE